MNAQESGVHMKEMAAINSGPGSGGNEGFSARLWSSLKGEAANRSDIAPDRGRLEHIDSVEDLLQQRIAMDPDAGAPERRRHYARAAEALSQARRNIHAKHGAPLLREWSQRAEQLAHQLDTGEVNLRDVSPNQLSEAYAYSTRHDPHTLTPESDPVQAAHAVLRAARRGDLEQALPGLNRLYANDLGAYVGQHMYDGGTISAPPRIVAAHPNPRDPSQTTLVAAFTAHHPDGREGTFVRPLMRHGVHASLHPDDDDHHPVLSLDTRELIHHTLGLATAILSTQHPAIQAKLRQASPDRSRKNRFLLELSTRLGSRDDYVPHRHYEFDEDGDMRVLSPSGGLLDVVRIPGRGLEESGARTRGQTDRRNSPANPDPYIRGRLYPGHDGRHARYLGDGRWGAP